MKIRLNLYHLNCQPEKIKFSFKQLVILSVGLLLLFIAALTIRHYYSYGNEMKIAASKGELQRLEKKLSVLIAKEESNSSLHDKVLYKNRLLNDVRSKNRLLDILSEVDLQGNLNFSELMYGLAQVNMDDIKLLKFQFIDNHLNVEGQASFVNSLPMWLSAFQSTPELRAISFDVIHIVEQNGKFHFQLKSDHEHHEHSPSDSVTSNREGQ